MFREPGKPSRLQPMPTSLLDVQHSSRGAAWKWWVCGLLLLATMINYMDRLTLNLMSVRIMTVFQLDEVHYGQLESGFAVAFALGAICIGWMADRWNVRWIYAASVFVWSLAGFATGLANGFAALLMCRIFLGLAEAGNWPCALRTTQRILPPAQRTMGNGILQSGAAIGAILTPIIIERVAPSDLSGSWRYPFMVIGAAGATWGVLWLLSMRYSDLAIPPSAQGQSLGGILVWLLLLQGIGLALRAFAGEWSWMPLVGTSLISILGIGGVICWLLRMTRDEATMPRRQFIRGFFVLAVLVVTINIAWHYFRAWLPLFLQRQHDYDERFSNHFMIAYYVATDLGSLCAGVTTLWLARRFLSVHGSRVVVFFVCAFLTCLSIVAALLPAGPMLLGVLLVIGFAALGLFPNYYSFSQELTVRHQGKVTGALGCINWLAMALLHELVGDSIKRMGSYSLGMALAGLAPMAGFLVLFLCWGNLGQSAKLSFADRRSESKFGNEKTC
jgi:ACS family hexuronate transporter-like MFS transporter